MPANDQSQANIVSIYDEGCGRPIANAECTAFSLQKKTFNRVTSSVGGKIEIAGEGEFFLVTKHQDFLPDFRFIDFGTTLQTHAISLAPKGGVEIFCLTEKGLPISGLPVSLLPPLDNSVVEEAGVQRIDRDIFPRVPGSLIDSLSRLFSVVDQREPATHKTTDEILSVIAWLSNNRELLDEGRPWFFSTEKTTDTDGRVVFDSLAARHGYRWLVAHPIRAKLIEPSFEHTEIEVDKSGIARRVAPKWVISGLFSIPAGQKVVLYSQFFIETNVSGLLEEFEPYDYQGSKVSLFAIEKYSAPGKAALETLKLEKEARVDSTGFFHVTAIVPGIKKLKAVCELGPNVFAFYEKTFLAQEAKAHEIGGIRPRSGITWTGVLRIGGENHVSGSSERRAIKLNLINLSKGIPAEDRFFQTLEVKLDTEFTLVGIEPGSYELSVLETNEPERLWSKSDFEGNASFSFNAEPASYSVFELGLRGSAAGKED